MALTEIPGGWIDESGPVGRPLWMTRSWDDQEQTIFHPRGTDGKPDVSRFVLSQVQTGCSVYVSSSLRKEFAAFQEAIGEAERWRKEERVGSDLEKERERDAFSERGEGPRLSRSPGGKPPNPGGIVGGAQAKGGRQ